MIKVVVVILSFVILSCSTMSTSNNENFLKHDEFAIYVNRGFTVTCLSAKKRACGIDLEQCLDGLAYMCATNVTIFSIDTFRNSPKSAYDR